jgi:hypothetical protein
MPGSASEGFSRPLPPTSDLSASAGSRQPLAHLLTLGVQRLCSKVGLFLRQGVDELVDAPLSSVRARTQRREPVFCTQEGGHLHPAHLGRDYWQPALSRAGLSGSWGVLAACPCGLLRAKVGLFLRRVWQGSLRPPLALEQAEDDERKYPVERMVYP